MVRLIARTVTVVSLGILLAGLMGSCGGSPGSDPFIVQKFEGIEGQLAKMKDVPTKVQNLNAEVVSLRDEIDRLRGVGGATSAPVALVTSVKLLNQRLTEMDARIRALEEAVRTQTRPGAVTPPKPTTPAFAPTPGPTGPAPTAPKATPMVLRTTPAAGTTTATALKPGAVPKPGGPVAPKPRRVEPPSVPRGQYYTAAEGDTVKGVADKFGIAVEEFCRSNTFLKPDSVLMPGQQYWVPVAKK